MSTVFVGIHIKDHPHQFLKIDDFDFGKTVLHLKQEIAEEVQQRPNKLELIYLGCILNDEDVLERLVRPAGKVQCLLKTSEPPVLVDSKTVNTQSETVMSRLQEFFKQPSGMSIGGCAHVRVLKVMLKQVPELRRDLGAQALLADRELFKQLSDPDVIDFLAKFYPVICVTVYKHKHKLRLSIPYSVSGLSPSSDYATSSDEEQMFADDDEDDPDATVNRHIPFLEEMLRSDARQREQRERDLPKLIEINYDYESD